MLTSRGAGILQRHDEHLEPLAYLCRMAVFICCLDDQEMEQQYQLIRTHYCKLPMRHGWERYAAVGSRQDLNPCVDLTILVCQMTAGGLVTVAASSSVLVCMVDVLAVVAVVTEPEVMDFKIEPSFSVQNPPTRRAG